MRQGGVEAGRIRTVCPGEEFDIKDVHIRVFGSHDPDAPDAVTYLLTSDRVTLFVSGDTHDGNTLRKIGEEEHPDLALLAFGSKRWYMTYDKMLLAGRRLNPKILLPFHWEVWRSETGDILELGKALAKDPPPFQVRLLQIGDRIDYDSQTGAAPS
jgi:L-ascorbate metabolism protein UlaG (beta-lactamase superfamily)